MRESVFRFLKFGSGLLLMAYVLLHLFNHSLGLHSIAAADGFRVSVMGLLHLPVLEWVVPLGLIVHVVCSLYAIARRRTLTGIGWPERIQVGFGLAIPLILLGHLIATWYARTAYGYQPSYAHYWAHEGATMFILLVTMLLTVWLHGCMGIHFWLRLKPTYQRWKWAAFSGALLWPTFSILGILSMLKEGRRRRTDPAWLTEISGSNEAMSYVEMSEMVDELAVPITVVFMGIVLGLLVVRQVRIWSLQRKLSVEVRYGGGQTISVAPGTTLLEASRMAKVSHAAVCGGRGRCSTCRTRVVHGLESLSDPDEQECRLLAKISAAPNVRLACQARAKSSCMVHPLLRAAKPSDGFPKDSHLKGQELEVTVLFADLRGFTQMSEGKLPYDLVYVLNQYFHFMGEAIESHNGYLDKFIGDGIMAIFGIKSGKSGADEAVAAAAAMGNALVALNHRLEQDLDSPLRLGIGLHSGPAIVGEMGYGDATQVTAIGDTVNQASRLESASKELGCQLVISEAVAERCKMDLSSHPVHEIKVRGVSEPVKVQAIAEAASVVRPVA